MFQIKHFWNLEFFSPTCKTLPQLSYMYAVLSNQHCLASQRDSSLAWVEGMANTGGSFDPQPKQLYHYDLRTVLYDNIN